MEQVKTVKRLCPGSGRAVEVRTREDGEDLNSGDVLHRCPVCGKGWVRNTRRDWSAVPAPRHFVEMVVREWDGKPGSQVPGRYYKPWIEMWVDERRVGHGLVVTLRDGYSFAEGYHLSMRTFDTAAAAAEAVRDPFHCYCGECSRRIVAVES